MPNEMTDAIVAKTDAKPSPTPRDLAKTYEGLEWGRQNKAGGLDGGDKYVFVKVPHDNDFAPPATLPRITHTDHIYFLIPADIKLPNDWREKVSPYLAKDAVHEGEVFIPERAADWLDDAKIDDAKIIQAIKKHHAAVGEANRNRKDRELLERERRPSSDLYANAAWIDEETPMLIEGLMRERGVSVFYGAFDEFKTTLVLDMVAHVAMGAPWQGRKGKPRPVIWYALEGKEEIPVRLRALEASLKAKDTPWGDDRAPVTVLDRIPEDYCEWRAEIGRIGIRWEDIYFARNRMGEMPTETKGEGGTYESIRYEVGNPPVIVIDTLSLALGGDDEKGPRAVGFVTDCLDLLKERPDTDQWSEENPEIVDIYSPVASHVIIIHHQTKTGIDFAGHRAIAANTQGLYRVHRFGKITDAERPYAGQLTPIRVKGIPRPAPIRFDVDVVPVDGTKQTAAILKDKATAIPKELKPVIEALRELENPEAIPPADLNGCLDVVAARGAKVGPAKRKARQRYREKLEAAGVIEPIEDENGKVAFYRFHDTAAV